MKVVISPRAEKQLRKAPKFDQIALAKKIRSLVHSFSPFGQERLKGHQNLYRVRVGNYRIVYKKTSKELFIILIGHRKDIYKLLRQLIS